ncbi:MAG: hypothetical protein ACE37F_02850 [Nannocystaceae bacterium]|nr:hypothetical protein [bacterium]
MLWTVALLLMGSAPEAKAEKEDLGRQKVSATALAVSGASMAPGANRTHLMRSPAMLLFDLGFFHPEHQWLEFSPSLMMEFERGQNFGLGFRLRAFTSLGPLRLYALGGIEAFVAPRKLMGARLGAGMAIPLHRHFAVVAEFGPTFYFGGDDIADRSSLIKLDGGAGIRVSF